MDTATLAPIKHIYTRTHNDYRDEAHAMEARMAGRVEQILDTICSPLGWTWTPTPEWEWQVQGVDYLVTTHRRDQFRLDVKTVDSRRFVKTWDRYQRQSTSVEIEQTTSAWTIRPGWAVDPDKTTELVMWVWADATELGLHEWLVVRHDRVARACIERPDHFHRVRTSVGTGATCLLWDPVDYARENSLVFASWSTEKAHRVSQDPNPRPPVPPRWA